jgi:hypothetical protein
MAAGQKQSARFEFPSMVYDMLEEVSYDPKASKIVSWMPHGRAFKVHKPDNFEAEVMPKYFRERYSSFRYLLEQWSFHGLRRGRDRGAYYNVNFVRGERHKIINITKEFMEDTMPKYLAPRDEPDFYSMEPAISKPPEPKLESQADRKRKANQLESSKTKSAPARKANNAPKRIRTNPRKRSEDRKESAAIENHHETFSESSHESEDEAYIAQPEARAPLRRTARVRQQPHYEEEPQPRMRRSVASSKESSSINNSRSSHNSIEELETKDSTEESSESPNKDSPILLPPSKAVFSGFNLPFKKLKLVVMSSGDLQGEDPFAVKRPKRRKVVAA